MGVSMCLWQRRHIWGNHGGSMGVIPGVAGCCLSSLCGSVQGGSQTGEGDGLVHSTKRQREGAEGDGPGRMETRAAAHPGTAGRCAREQCPPPCPLSGRAPPRAPSQDVPPPRAPSQDVPPPRAPSQDVPPPVSPLRTCPLSGRAPFQDAPPPPRAPSQDVLDPKFNTYADNFDMVTAALQCGMYPNMCWVKGGRKASSMIRQKIFTVDAQLVRCHPGSCNCEQILGDFLVYFERMRSSNGPIFLLDSSLVNPLPTILFGAVPPLPSA